MKILVTGGTVFVSKYIASYFQNKHEVYVLNRGTKEQLPNVKLIKASREELPSLHNYCFDAIIDVTSYTKKEMEDLLSHTNKPQVFIFISSSAVYKQSSLPLKEDSNKGWNEIWKDYGKNKLEAEEYLLSKNKEAYILRPPYLYGPMNNLYREAFVFDACVKGEEFYLPEKEFSLQFFHVDDLCKIIEMILQGKVEEHILNIGNEEKVSLEEWIKLCYGVNNKTPKFKYVDSSIFERLYFPFYNYDYYLDITKMKNYLPIQISLSSGFKDSYEWYKLNQDKVIKKDYFKFIQENLE